LKIRDESSEQNLHLIFASRDCEEMMKKRIAIIAFMILILAVGLSAKKVKTMDNFEIVPNPMYRSTTIYVNMSEPAEVQITIDNLAGETIRTIYAGVCGKSASFLWERDDAEGNYVADGTYYVTLRYEGRYTSTKKTLILK